jgi:hypothetical protein
MLTGPKSELKGMYDLCSHEEDKKCPVLVDVLQSLILVTVGGILVTLVVTVSVALVVLPFQVSTPSPRWQRDQSSSPAELLGDPRQ